MQKEKTNQKRKTSYSKELLNQENEFFTTVRVVKFHFLA
jgi:hypothetical protein